MLAESWTFDKANREYTIHLRKGVMWHPITLPNGEVLPPKEVTARDVKFTFDCILNRIRRSRVVRSYYEDNESDGKFKSLQDQSFARTGETNTR